MLMMPRARRVALHAPRYIELPSTFGCHALSAWSLTFLTITI